MPALPARDRSRELTFLHAADLHLDSPLVGLERYAAAPVAELRSATRRAFENLVSLAIESQVAFVLISGDLFDGDWKDYNTGLFFAQQLARLKESGIPVIMVAGNHDAASQITRSLRTPDNLVRLSTTRAETHVVEGTNVAIHGRGFATRVVDEDLSASFPAGDPGCFNIGLLHTSLDGREGHAPYAPCSLQSLRAKHYGYWALGHVHAREVVSSDPWVVFPGNPQGRHARETGPKGCTLVTVADREVVRVEERHLDVVRWSRCTVDLTGTTSSDEALDGVGKALAREVEQADGRLLAVRLELRGATAAHGAFVAHPEHWEQELRALGVDRCGEGVWLEKVRFSTRPTDQPPDTRSSEALEGLLHTLQGIEPGEALLEELRRAFSDLRARLPIELVGPDVVEPLDLASPVLLGEVVRQARELLLARLTTDGR